MKYSLPAYPIVAVRNIPTKLEKLALFYSNLNKLSVTSACPCINCINFQKILEFKKSQAAYDGFIFFCKNCKQKCSIRPPLFRGLHASYQNLSDALIYFLNGCSSKSIFQNIPSLSHKTLYSLKLRIDALILTGNTTVAPLIKLGGNKGGNRVETDDLVNGRRRKGRKGHATQILNNVWGARGIDPSDGKKKWLLEPFYLGIGKEVSTKDVKPFLDKHIANESWFITDGGRAYLGWVNKTKKNLKHFISNHSDHEFVRKNVKHKDFLGQDSVVKIHTNDVEGGWKHFRLAINNEGGVRQKRMRGFCHRLCFFFNHRGQNMLMCFSDFMHIDVGSAKKCKKILHWNCGYKYRNKRKKTKSSPPQKITKGVKSPCKNCGKLIGISAQSKSQHKLYYCAATKYKRKKKRLNSPLLPTS